jgi:glutamate N-acetyltransferase/amino-acid N-acetyltransferase
MKGFLFSAVEAGVRYPGRLDVGLIHSPSPCVTAGVFTTNLVKAAPVVIGEKRLQGGMAQTILVNSGCANACTGEAGTEAALYTSKLVSDKLGVDDQLIQLSSTGVIGEPLNTEAFEKSMDALVAGLGEENFEDVAKAIMTTDTVHKVAQTSLNLHGHEIQIRGMAKGSGMIMPNMATMLAFVFTDAKISVEALQHTLSAANDRTFNRITVDGDTSTNDMVLVMANGEAKNRQVEKDMEDGDLEVFRLGLQAVLKDLALQIVADGEGATKSITIAVKGAEDDESALQIARTVATSSLVKTAFFGEDANWGRIIAAMGRAGVAFDPYRIDLYFGDVQLVKDGLGLDKNAEEAATAVLKGKNVKVVIAMNQGDGESEVYTCDFSLDYVKINADYRS